MTHELFLNASTAEMLGFTLLVVHVATLYVILGIYLPHRNRVDMEVIFKKITADFGPVAQRRKKVRHDHP